MQKGAYIFYQGQSKQIHNHSPSVEGLILPLPLFLYNKY